MKCYNHPNIDAVGMCKECNKGVCSICAKDTSSGITCSKTCTLNTELTKSTTNSSTAFLSSQKAIKSYLIIFSGLFLVVNGLQQPYGHTPFILTGIAFFFWGAYNLHSGYFLKSR